jgi:hypothetical protein
LAAPLTGASAINGGTSPQNCAFVATDEIEVAAPAVVQMSS